MTEPFTPDSVLYRFSPTEEERSRGLHLSDDYVIAGPPLRIWGRSGTAWEEVTYWRWHIVMRRLLADLTQINHADDGLGNLLAVLHGDGGHHQGQYGTEKAVKDAMVQHYARLKEIARLTTERDLYREELERVLVEYQHERVRIDLCGERGGPQEAHYLALSEKVRAVLDQGANMRAGK